MSYRDPRPEWHGPPALPVSDDPDQFALSYLRARLLARVHGSRPCRVAPFEDLAFIAHGRLRHLNDQFYLSDGRRFRRLPTEVLRADAARFLNTLRHVGGRKVRVTRDLVADVVAQLSWITQVDPTSEPAWRKRHGPAGPEGGAG